MYRQLVPATTAIVLYALCSLTFADQIAPFTSDGCSAFPDGNTEEQTLWLNCCVSHDLSYWKGGTYEERIKADAELESCVAKLGETEIGKLMYAGVRVGGSPYLPMPYRWGYGWPFPRGYQALTNEEKQQAKQQLRQFIKMLESAEAELN
ncbi:FAD-binding oxidoreductase [Saccharophagus degradans]|uniref:FAD-binding oxidoreductase n=1 Tax=Saccharophagus degradans TaxID=86304 RepID=UPI001C085A06|nr:FAD-binding oxidoreductase [Saccharophagus degradans]MBU2984441.1 FAD-binding oxidoreductase [Saccharophagus degradans]